ncbi:MAG: hypothetical protein AB1Z67_11250 [Candidatus Limnocylindrales bacterium]
MSETSAQPSSQRASPWAPVLRAAGLVYLALGGLTGIGWLSGNLDPALFPTGWIFPAVLLGSGALMTARRRFDLAVTLWAGLTVAIFILAALTYTDALTLGLDDPAAFDSSVIAAALGLMVLVLRPAFRD